MPKAAIKEENPKSETNIPKPNFFNSRSSIGVEDYAHCLASSQQPDQSQSDNPKPEDDIGDLSFDALFS